MNRLSEFIESLETECIKFQPNKDFYKSIGIGQRRFWQIMRNETQPTLDELEKIAKKFDIKNPKDLIA